jgi:hypothetical protein
MVGQKGFDGVVIGFVAEFPALIMASATPFCSYTT